MAKISEFIVDNSKGLVKNERQADIILVIFIGVLILASFFLLLINSGSKNIKGTEYNPSSGYGGRHLPDNYR